MEREKITEQYLFEHGFKIDESLQEIFDTYKIENLSDEENWCKDPIRFYINEDHRISIHHRWTNRYGEAYNVHIDNEDYESVGCLEVLYVDDLETFIKIAYDDDKRNE